MNRHPLSKPVFLVVTLLILGAFGWSVQAKEELIRTGQTVLLELAPADPRSLMQGDYMRLNYKVANDARTANGTGAVNFRDMGGENEMRHSGYIVIEAENGIARFARLEDAVKPLGPNEYRLRYHRKWSQVNIVPNSYMFEEGQASNYARAKYGVFRFDHDGNVVLTSLADENREQIEPRVTAKAVLP